MKNTRFLGARASRRTFLRTSAGAGVGAAAIGLVGCGDDDDDEEATATAAAGAATATATAAAQPKRGGTFIHSTSFLSHLDIHQVSYAGVSDVTLLVYNRLVRPTVKDQLPEPDLATAMPEQPDNLTFIFKLPANAKFHDRAPVNGRVVTAEDVVFSLQRAATDGPTFAHKGEIRSIDKIEAVDKTTVRITTKQPDAALLASLSLPPFIVFAREVLDKFPDLKAPDAAIGTGPFILENWSRETGGKLKRNPAYFREGLPYLDAVEQRTLDPDPAWTAFLAGQIHTAAVPEAEEKDFKANPKFPFAESGSHATAIGRIMNTKRPPFDDERVRRAVGLICDRDASIEFQQFGNGRASVCLAYDHAFWNLSVEETAKLPGFGKDKAADKKQAIALLEAAGYSKSNPVKADSVAWSHPSRQFGIPALEYLKQELEQGSGGIIQASLRPMEPTAWLDNEARGLFDFTTAVWVAGIDPDHLLSRMHHTVGGRNYGRISDPTLDAMLDKERATFDVKDRVKQIHEVLRYIAEKSPTAWLTAGPGVTAWQPFVKGYAATSYARGSLENTWLDK